MRKGNSNIAALHGKTSETGETILPKPHEKEQRQTEKNYNIFKIFNKGIICIQEYILGDYFYKRSIHIKYNYKILYH